MNHERLPRSNRLESFYHYYQNTLTSEGLSETRTAFLVRGGRYISIHYTQNHMNSLTGLLFQLLQSGAEVTRCVDLRMLHSVEKTMTWTIDNVDILNFANSLTFCRPPTCPNDI